MKKPISKIPIIIVCVIAVLAVVIVLFTVMLKAQKIPKLVFSEAKENAFELQRIVVESKKITLTSAGTLKVDGDIVIPQIEKPLFPWESSSGMEYTSQIWGGLPLLLKGIAEEKKIPLGVVEYFNHYYLVAENGKQQYLYSLASANPINAAVKSEDFFNAIKSYHADEENKLISGGNGLRY